MTRINLLPHREQKKKRQQQQLGALAGIVLVLAGLMAFSIHTVIVGKISNQENRNKYLQDEILKLDKEIAEIKQLKEQVGSLLERKQVVESLQGNRAQVVLLFEDLIRLLPDGMYLKSVRQSGASVTLTGLTQSNARVSTLMRNLEGSPYLESPKLQEIKAVTAGGSRASEFTLTVKLTPPQLNEQKTPVAGEIVGKKAAGASTTQTASTATDSSSGSTTISVGGTGAAASSAALKNRNIKDPQGESATSKVAKSSSGLKGKSR